MATGVGLKQLSQMGQSAVLSAPATAPVASKTLAEAQTRARRFFREVCREVPWIMQNYQLEEVTTTHKLRSQIAELFRGAATTNPAVVDTKLFKAQAEITNVLAHYTQRHHLITKYVAGDAAGKITDTLNAGQSHFLTSFYKGQN